MPCVQFVVLLEPAKLLAVAACVLQEESIALGEPPGQVTVLPVVLPTPSVATVVPEAFLKVMVMSPLAVSLIAIE
jgi:hypothetical protein